MTEPFYCSREELMAAADVAVTAHVAPQLDRILDAASRSVDKSMHRFFYPYTTTRTLFPDGQVDRDTLLWSFDVPDLLDITVLVIDGVTIDTDGWRLEDIGDHGPPFTQLALVARSGREVAITGTWGYGDAAVPAGLLGANINASVTQVLVSNSAAVGIGHLIGFGAERMIVTGKGMADTGNNITADIAALASATTVGVADGGDYSVGEVLLIDSERMRIVDIAGNNAVVDRAVDGSVLAAHTTGADIYAPRSLTVERGATGSTAAAHTTGAACSRFTPPSPIRSLVLAEALVAYEQEKGAYGRVVGSGDGQREASGKGLADVRKRARIYRRARWGVI